MSSFSWHLSRTARFCKIRTPCRRELDFRGSGLSKSTYCWTFFCIKNETKNQPKNETKKDPQELNLDNKCTESVFLERADDLAGGAQAFRFGATLFSIATRCGHVWPKKGPINAPRAPPESPKSGQGLPKGVPRAPLSAQGRPKTAQSTPRTTQEHHKGTKIDPK